MLARKRDKGCIFPCRNKWDCDIIDQTLKNIIRGGRMDKIIEVTNLHKSYGEVKAVKGIDFYVERGFWCHFLKAIMPLPRPALSSAL